VWVVRARATCDDQHVETGGVVTVMHADVEGSTALTTRVGDAAAREVLSETKRLVRERCEARGGREIDAVGDAMMLTFTSTRAAIAAGMEIQEALARRERETPETTLRVRIGINVGEVLGHDATPFGAAVNAGARVMALGEGGDILVSEMAQRLAGTVPGVAFRDRGRHSFKGFEEPWRVYQVMWDGAPPPRPRSRQRPQRRLVLAAAIAVVAAAVAAVVIARGGNGAAHVALRSNTVGLLDGSGRGFISDIAVGPGPAALAAFGSTLWVGNYDGQTVTRVAEAQRVAVTTFPVGGHPTTLLADAHGAWVAELLNRRLVRVDAQYDRPVRTIHAAVTALAYAGGFLWDATADQQLERRDAASGRLLWRTTPRLGVGALAVTAGTLWVVGSGEAVPFDPVRGISLGPGVALASGRGFAAAAGGRLWIAGDGSVQEVDPSHDAVVQTVALQSHLSPTQATQPLAATPDEAYVVDPVARAVIRVGADRSVTRLQIRATPRAALATPYGVWVAAA
jgi:class 3 adenylate cyclase